MAKSMTIRQVLDLIESSTSHFKLTFSNQAGKVQTRTCKTRIKHRTKEKKATKNSGFKYSLRDSYSLLLDMEGLQTPRTVKVYGILGFNDCKNIIH